MKDSKNGIIVVTNSESSSLCCGKLCCVTCLTIFLLSMVYSQGIHNAIPVKIKSQILAALFDSAKRHLKKFLRAENFHSRTKYYFCMTATNPNLGELIGDNSDKKHMIKELYQSKKCLLIIGSKKNFMYVIEVTFPDNLLGSYDTVIKKMYSKYYSFFYESTFEKDSFSVDMVICALEI